MKINYRRLSIAIALPLAAGFLGSIFTAPAITGWYAGLAKPVFAPPNWLFAPVWTALYIMMGLAAYLVWQKDSKSLPFKLYWAHLAFNAAWSPAFFGLRSPGTGLLVILVILAMVVYLVLAFWRIDKRASVLLWPYLAWVAFATTLNYFLLVLN